MAQLEISDSLYRQLDERAQQSGQTVAAFLEAAVTGQPLAHPGFVSLVTHDLRTPLATIMTSGDILRMFHDRLSEQQRLEHLAVIQMQVQVANDMLDNVMVIQKCAADSLTLDRAEDDLGVLCQTTIAEIDHVTQKSHQIAFTPGSHSVRATIDHALVRLALVNLLLNAIRFSEHDTAVRVSLHVDHDMAAIAVTDEGIGIPADELGRVRDLFYRATNARNIPGRGMGLAVVWHIARLHGGDISLESALNTGTTATLHLPLTS